MPRGGEDMSIPEATEEMRALIKADRERGLYEKFIVLRSDGSSGPGGKHEHCKYFVLDLNHDKFAAAALDAYATACEGEFPRLAFDLRTTYWIRTEAAKKGEGA